MTKNIIFITTIKSLKFPARSESYKYCVNSWKQWAKKNNSEIFLLKNAIYPPEEMNPNWHKLFVFDLLESNNIKYDQILIVDADIIVHPNCPNFFEMTDNKFTVVRAVGSMDWILRSLENYSKYFFENKIFDWWKYFNSGFMVVNKSHKYIIKSTLQTYLNNKDVILSIQNHFNVGTDQPMLNFMVNLTDIEMKFLPYEYNMQDMSRLEILTSDFLFTKIGWIYHFNAMPNNENYIATNQWMKKTYKYLYDKRTKKHRT